MRLPNSREWWETETQFIEAESTRTYRMGGFERYCDMQARFAAKDGFPALAARIREASAR